MNWGYRLLVVFFVFAAGMGLLIYRSLHTTYELVEKDYYATELRYQQIIDDSRRANLLSRTVELVQQPGGILVQLPEEMKNNDLEGSIWFYCAYDRGKDRKYRLQTNKTASQLIPLENLEPGNYSVKINWKKGKEGFYTEKNFTVM